METPHDLRVARAVQLACIDAARQAYIEAAQSGLCGEGALEAAVGAMHTLDITAVACAATQVER